MAAELPSIMDDAPPRVAAPPTMSRIGSAYLIGPDVSAACFTVITPAPSLVADGLGPGEEDEPDPVGLGLGLVFGFGFRRLPF
jgi:hypothetical protein